MKMSKKKIVIISIVSILVIAGAVFAYLYFCTDLFKQTKELFYEYVGKAATTEGNYTYQDMLDDLKNAQTKSFTSKSTIGFELNDKGSSLSSVKNQAAYSALKDLKLNVETKSNPNDKKAACTIGIEYGNNKITDLKFVKTNDLYGIKSDLLDNKFIALENNNLKDFVAKLGVNASFIPNKIEEIDLYDLLYVSKENQDKISNTYKKVLKDSIPSSNYTKLDNVNKTVNGQEQNLTGYSLKITSKDLSNILNNLLNTAKDDDTTLDIIVEKLNKIMETPLIKTSLESYQAMANSKPVLSNNLLGNTSLGNTTSIYAKQKEFTIPKITKETIKQSLEQITNQLKVSTEATANVGDSQMLEFIVYESNGKTAKMELKVVGQTIMAIDFYEENGNNHAVIYSARAESTSRYSAYPSMKLVKMMDMTYNVKQNGNEKKALISMAMFNEDKEVAKISFDVKTNGKVGVGTNNTTSIISIDTPKMGMSFNIDSQIEYTDNVEIEEVNNSNATILNNMSKAEIEAYFKNLSDNLKKMTTNIAMPSSIIPTFPSTIVPTTPSTTTPSTAEPIKIPDVQNPFENLNLNLN